jgi:hypothetical protein
MFHRICACLILAGLVMAANAGTIEYLSRDAWQAAVISYSSEDFSRPIGDSSSSLDFSLAALTSTGRSSSDSNTHPDVKHFNTSFIDLFANPEGGNYVGTTGRTSLSTSTVTTTNTEWCKNGTCTPDTPQQNTTYSDYADVRSLEIDFHYATLNFGFDYVATLSGSSPDRANHPFRMILTFIDGTTSSLWIGGNSAFPSYSEGFMGITSDLYIASVTLRAADRSLGSTFTSVGGDWVYQQTKPKKGDQYTYSLQETTSSDQTSALMIGNLTATVPEPAPGVLIGMGGLLLGIGNLLRRYRSSKRSR